MPVESGETAEPPSTGTIPTTGEIDWSPDPADTITDILEQIQIIEYEQDQPASYYRISECSFQKLNSHLKKVGLRNIRPYKYDVPSETLILRKMPWNVHGTIHRLVLLLLEEKLRGASVELDFIRALSEVEVRLKHNGNRTGVREPDIQLFNPLSQLQGVVFEIAVSQRMKGLKEAAKDYIYGTHGHVRVVVGIKVEAEKTRVSKITLCVWRAVLRVPDKIKCVQDEDKIIWERGEMPVDREAILLRLRSKDIFSKPLASPDSGDSTSITYGEFFDAATKEVQWLDMVPLADAPLDPLNEYVPERSESPSEPSQSEPPTPCSKGDRSYNAK